MNNFTQSVFQKFLNTVNEYNMLENVKTVVVGFSGGADSVCLLHILYSFKKKFGYNIKAVHINHGIRGAEAERDKLFAEEFCRNLNIPFKAVKLNCIEEAEKNKESLEECGRRLRYQQFNELCGNNSKIATAHNANDNAETIIFNITRGTTVKGLCGIPFVRDNIIRPILNCSRKEIEGYCKENNLSYVTDSTNLSDDYTRNKIRNNILPVIEEINPAYLNTFTSLADNAFCVTDYLSSQADLLLCNGKKDENVFDRTILNKSHKSVCAESLFKAYKDFSGKSLDNKKVNALLDLLKSGGRIQLFGDDFAEVKKDYLRFYTVDTNNADSGCLINSLPFSTKFNGYSIVLEKCVNYSKIVNQNDMCNMLDYASVVGKLALRTRKPGDEFTFKKRGVTKSLKKLFSEENIPVEIRNKIPVISDDIGVVWVQGFGVNKRCLASKDCGNIVLVRGENNDR